jgi:hypothetical protein
MNNFWSQLFKKMNILHLAVLRGFKLLIIDKIKGSETIKQITQHSISHFWISLK